MNPAEKPALTISSAPEYILDNFEHTDRIAVLVLNREFGETIQRITSAQKAASPVICLLDIPVNKTSTAFTKPVDPVVGEAIRAWEVERPVQPVALDDKMSTPHGLCALRVSPSRGEPGGHRVTGQGGLAAHAARDAGRRRRAVRPSRVASTPSMP